MVIGYILIRSLVYLTPVFTPYIVSWGGVTGHMLGPFTLPRNICVCADLAKASENGISMIGEEERLVPAISEILDLVNFLVKCCL